MLWNSERVWPWRFYADYLRWPLLFIVLAFAGDKLIYYGALPLGSYVTREYRYLAAARDFGRGDDKAALSSIRSALLQTRDNPQLWRLAAEISDRLDSPEAAYCWAQVDHLSPGCLATKIHLAQAALNHGQLDLALEALRSVAPEDETQLPCKLLDAQVSDAAGQRAEAHRFFEEVEAAHPADGLTLLALAQWHAKSTNREELDRAQRLAFSLAQHGSLCLAAGRLLVEIELRRHDVKGAMQASDRVLDLPEPPLRIGSSVSTS